MTLVMTTLCLLTFPVAVVLTMGLGLVGKHLGDHSDQDRVSADDERWLFDQWVDPAVD